MDFLVTLLVLWLFGWILYRVFSRLFQTRGYRDRQRKKYARDYWMY